MSQSDYIKYKRIANELKNDQSKHLPVFKQSDYLSYKQFTLENTITNTNPILNMLTPTGVKPVFQMNNAKYPCATFEVCNTNLASRANRVPLSTVYFTPKPQPLSILVRNEAANLKNECISAPNTRYSQYYLCSNKLGKFGIVR